MKWIRISFQKMTHSLPTLLVFGLLGTVAVWGHHSDWKLPRFSTFIGNQTEEPEDWCVAHNVPASRCIACNPELAGEDPASWCKEHGVPEAECSICHPEILQGGSADWCKEHGIPESSCTLCHPDLAVKGAPPKNDVEPIVAYDSGMVLEKDPRSCRLHHAKIQFASAESVKKAGVGFAAVVEGPISAKVEAYGELSYNQNRVVRVPSRVEGVVWSLHSEVGNQVKQGDILAIIDSHEIGRAKSDLVRAVTVCELKEKFSSQMQSLFDEQLVTRRELTDAKQELADAQATLLTARQALFNLGFDIRVEDMESLPPTAFAEKVNHSGLPENILSSISDQTIAANLIAVRSPQDGTVIAKDAVVGEAVDPGQSLFTVADTATMWVVANVALEKAASISLGQKMSFCVDGGSDDRSFGQVTWISTEVDEKTRTVPVRCEVQNPNGMLRAHAFGTAAIVTREHATATLVPNDAIHWEGCCNVAFVRLTDDIFQTRKVRVGVHTEYLTEISIGLEPGEVVAAQGSHVLLADLLKSNLGAG